MVSLRRTRLRFRSALGNLRRAIAFFSLFALVAGAELHAGQELQRESDPNDTSATATSIVGTNAVLLGHVFPAADVDYYSFPAHAGDRVYAATMTAFSSVGVGTSGDTVLDLLASDGSTVIESDNDDGSFTAPSSSIAGGTVPSNGIYYLRVRNASVSNQTRPYHLHFQLRNGSPNAEVEDNGPGSPQSLPSGGWITGSALGADVDAFRLALNAGDTVFASLDLDPERDSLAWAGQLQITSLNGGSANAIVNDTTASAPPSEALFWTVDVSGNYDVQVRIATGGGGTYHLSLSVHPNTNASSSCTTYANPTDVTIPTGPDLVSSIISVPGNPRIADLDVTIDLSHARLQDLDVHLVSPSNSVNGHSSNGLFRDQSGPTTIDLRFDDQAAVPLGSFSATASHDGVAVQPQPAYRLARFDGENAGGDWQLNLFDDQSGSGGTLNGWSITVCEAPPVCPAETTPVTLFSEDFEASDGSFAATGVGNEWAWGTPSIFTTIDDCGGGSGCWKTDLLAEYDLGTAQDLISRPISLVGKTGLIVATWAQKYQMRSSSLDHIYVESREVGGGNPRRHFEHLEGDMADSIGNPATDFDGSAGWGQFRADLSSRAGQTVELRFHLDSSAGVLGRAGFAVDDVAVTECQVPEPQPGSMLAAGAVLLAWAGHRKTRSPGRRRGEKRRSGT